MDLTPPRWIRLEGTANTRDLGGRPVADGGGHVRAGVALRSDNLQDLTPADVEFLVDRVGVSTVVDLRTDGERRSEGTSPLQRAGIRHVPLSLVPVVTGDGLLPDRRGTDPAQVYRGYLLDAPREVGRAVTEIAHGPGAVVFHCAAGKDRTGMLAALLLEVVGVPRVEVVADYLATNEVVAAVIARLAASPTYRTEVLASADAKHETSAATMRTVLGWLDEDYDGPAGWLQKEAGVSEETLAALRHRLVQPR